MAGKALPSEAEVTAFRRQLVAAAQQVIDRAVAAYAAGGPASWAVRYGTIGHRVGDRLIYAVGGDCAFTLQWWEEGRLPQGWRLVKEGNP